MRPVDIVKHFCPAAKKSYIDAFEAADKDFARFGINTPKRVSCFLANVFAETGDLTIEYESGNYRAERIVEIFGVGHHSAAVTAAEAQRLAGNGPALFERVYGLGNPAKARELGNTRPGDGWLFRGTGPMQMTGGANFKRIGQKIGAPLYEHPEQALWPQYLLLPAFVEWDEDKLNAYADRDDMLATARAINIGNTKTTKMPNGWDDRNHYWQHLRRYVQTVELQDGGPQPSAPTMSPATSDSPSTPVLRRGSRGVDVERLQRALVAAGYATKVDGDFGPATESVVRVFQSSATLKSDGIVGEQTWNKLTEKGKT